MVRIQEIPVEEDVDSDSMRPQFDAVAEKVNAALTLNRQKCAVQAKVMSQAS